MTLFSPSSPVRALACLFLVGGISMSGPAQESVAEEKVPLIEAVDEFKLQRLYVRHTFDCPVALVRMPATDGDKLVLVQQRGQMWILPDDEVLGTPVPFLDLRDHLKKVILFEEGLHGLAFHPEFASNGKFYLSYSHVEPRRTVLSEMQVLASDPLKGDPDSERILLQEPHIMANHFSGWIAFGPDQKLYMTIGDGGMREDPYRMSQNPFSLLGKMLRLDVDARTGGLPYGIPEDNPFAENQEYRAEIWALGLRNPWGVSFDEPTGDLWLADVGQDIWEEVNLIKKGGNYGWSDRDGPRQSALHATPLLPERKYQEPLFAYTHAEGISVTGGFMYRGSRLPKLDGCYVFADWGSGIVWGLRYDPDSGKVKERLVLHRRPEGTEEHFNPTMIAPDLNGEIVIMSQEGKIYTMIAQGD